MTLSVSEAVAMKCGQCGVEFWVPQWFNSERKETGEAWYCPNGHQRVYRETVTQERDRLKQKVAELHDEACKARSDAFIAEEKVRKLKKRAAVGTCPCCKRTFSELARHMKAKHPDFHTADVVPLKRRVAK